MDGAIRDSVGGLVGVSRRAKMKKWRTEVPAEYTRAIDFFRGQDDEGLLSEYPKAVVEYVGWLERRLDGKATPFERVATRSEVEELRRRVETLEARAYGQASD
jgi:hypothetical protein